VSFSFYIIILKWMVIIPYYLNNTSQNDICVCRWVNEALVGECRIELFGREEGFSHFIFMLKLIIWYIFLHHTKRFFVICSIYRDTAILVDICIPNVIRSNAIWHEIRWYNSRERYIWWKNVKLREIMQHYVNWQKKGPILAGLTEFG